jgi:hypothetical protein
MRKEVVQRTYANLAEILKLRWTIYWQLNRPPSNEPTVFPVQEIVAQLKEMCKYFKNSTVAVC